MRKRGFGSGLIGLALVGLLLAGTAQKSRAEEKADISSGPSGWVRVDGQDHDLDEMLSLFRPKGAETLAVFAPLQAWKPFYDKIYGLNPIDLAFYAAIYRLSLDGPDLPNLNDWPYFYQEDETRAAAPNQPWPDSEAPPGEPLGQPSPVAVTFKASLAPSAEVGRQDSQDEDKGAKTSYTVITSIVLTRQEILFLNLFQANQDDFDELERLALAWRADFLEANAQPLEEPWREQDLE